MIRAGESGGVLDEILERLAEYREKAQKLQSRRMLMHVEHSGRFSQRMQNGLASPLSIRGGNFPVEAEALHMAAE